PAARLVEQSEALDGLRRSGELAQPRIVVAHEAPVAVAAVFSGQARRERIEALRVDLVQITEKSGLKAQARRERHRRRGRRACGEDGQKQLESDAWAHATDSRPRCRRGSRQRARWRAFFTAFSHFLRPPQLAVKCGFELARLALRR